MDDLLQPGKTAQWQILFWENADADFCRILTFSKKKGKAAG
jgi:hypothetical protein